MDTPAWGVDNNISMQLVDTRSPFPGPDAVCKYISAGFALIKPTIGCTWAPLCGKCYLNDMKELPQVSGINWGRMLELNILGSASLRTIFISSDLHTYPVF